ncbi:hypothetical protein [Nocardia cyriacigeorgica]|uniref:hypothetical protein n=1 Tax=Nocardia cyriacigeorgica TaxID=135487 RepID=UPI002458B1A2|nr:hypothetical protein [Nocardia cyriacigeorgica]
MSIWHRKESAGAEVARLRKALADRDRELSDLRRQLDDALDRESLHVNAPTMERLTPAASIDRIGRPRACHAAPTRTPAGEKPQLRVINNVSELTITAPRIDHGVWEGFDR